MLDDQNTVVRHNGLSSRDVSFGLHLRQVIAWLVRIDVVGKTLEGHIGCLSSGASRKCKTLYILKVQTLILAAAFSNIGYSHVVLACNCSATAALVSATCKGDSARLIRQIH